MIYTITSDTLSVSINSLGAELNSIRSLKDGTEYLWQGDPAYWKGHGYNLFPYVGRMTEQSYFIDGQKYHMGLHGFARHSEFAVISRSSNAITFELTENEETLKEYPRRFSFRVTYRLESSRLDYIWEVENTDTRALHFGIGGHPGFNVPMKAGLAFTDYRIEFDGDASKANLVNLTDDVFPDGTVTPYPMKNGNSIPLDHSLFTRDAVVLTDVPHTVSILTDKDSHGVRVTFDQMPYVGFWHKPNSDAPYVCIEPWVSLPSKKDEIAVFEEGEDLIHVEPGKTYENDWSIEVF